MDLHAVYMAINTYTHNTGTKQSIIMSNKFLELWVVSTSCWKICDLMKNNLIIFGMENQ